MSAKSARYADKDKYNEVQRRYYHNNKERFDEKQRRTREDRIAFLYENLGTKCVNCGCEENLSSITSTQH